MAFANHGFDPNKKSFVFTFQLQNIIGSVTFGVGNDEEIK